MVEQGRRSGRQRVALLAALLFGLFLMHGVTAPGGGCHNAAPAMVMSAPAAGHSVHAPTAQRPSASDAKAGETCTPLKPEGMAGLFLALFLIVITLWRPKLPAIFAAVRRYWPHGPPRRGADALLALCVSRT